MADFHSWSTENLVKLIDEVLADNYRLKAELEASQKDFKDAMNLLRENLQKNVTRRNS
jgi:hypothetical protein